MKRFNKYTALVGTAVAIMVVFAGIAVASNMGFKLNRALVQQDGAASVAFNYISLPYNNSFGDASALFGDVTNATLVSRWNTSTAAFENYNGGRGSINFSISAGEAYVVQVSGDGSWIVVGSHAPGTNVGMVQQDGAASVAFNYISVPYHTTSANAAGLFGEITNSTLVSRWNPSTAAFENYNGGRGSINFTVAAGEGYVAQVSADGNWAPAHY